MFVHTINCPICNLDKTVRLFEKEGATFVQCVNDKLVFINPQPDSRYLKELYDAYGDEYMTHSHRLATTETHPDYRKSFLEFRMNNAILEIGAAAGTFLSLLKEDGWNVYGVEISSPSARYARECNGLNVKTGTVHDAGYKKDFFDVVVAWATIEHVPNPEDVMKEVHRILRPGGLFVLSVPHWNGLSIRLIQKKYRYVGRDHLFYFGSRNVTKLLRSIGFSKVKTKTVGVDIIELYQDALGLASSLCREKKKLPCELTDAGSLLRIREQAREKILSIPFLPIRRLYSILRWGVEKLGMGDALYAEAIK